jgi:hypothetical protein
MHREWHDGEVRRVAIEDRYDAQQIRQRVFGESEFGTDEAQLSQLRLE